MARGDRYVRLGIRGDTPSVLAIVESEHAAHRRRLPGPATRPAAAALLARHLAHSALTIGSYIAPGDGARPPSTAAARTHMLAEMGTVRDAPSRSCAATA